FFSSRRRHTRWPRDWSSDVCSSDLDREPLLPVPVHVLGQFVTGLLHGLEERSEERARGRTALEHQRAGLPPIRIAWVRGQAVLRSEERRVRERGWVSVGAGWIEGER